MLTCPGSLPCLGCGHAARRVGGGAGWACRGLSWHSVDWEHSARLAPAADLSP